MLADRLRGERDARGWSLAQLAARSGVSRAMLSKIEREETSPTAVILVRIATAFGMTLAQFLTSVTAEAPRLARAGEQPCWRDPKTGHVRKQVLLDARSGLEMVDVTLPPGAALSFPAHVYQHTRHFLWMLSGRLALTEGQTMHNLDPGDRLEFGEPSQITFNNPHDDACRYLVVLLRT